MDPNDRDLDDEEIKLPEDDDEGQDAGSVNDEGGDDSETGQELEDAQSQARVRSRASERIQTLRAEAQAARERTALLERELQEERARRQQPQQQSQEESDDAFNARIAMLDAEQRMDAKLERATKRHQRELLISNMRSADLADRAAFQAKAAFDPYFKKYADEVERTLAEERRNGRDWPRETVLDFVIGRAARTNPNRSKQKAAGQERIARQQARDDGGRGDISARRERAGQGDSLEAIKRRLTGVQI